jgi:hypothetical protein
LTTSRIHIESVFGAAPSYHQEVRGNDVARLYSVVAGASISVGIFIVAIAAMMRLADVTNSGLFGICGPYGDDWSIYVQIVLLIVALLGSPIIGVSTGHYIYRRKAGSPKRTAA